MLLRTVRQRRFSAGKFAVSLLGVLRRVAQDRWSAVPSECLCILCQEFGIFLHVTFDGTWDMELSLDTWCFFSFLAPRTVSAVLRFVCVCVIWIVYDTGVVLNCAEYECLPRFCAFSCALAVQLLWVRIGFLCEFRAPMLSLVC